MEAKLTGNLKQAENASTSSCRRLVQDSIWDAIFTIYAKLRSLDWINTFIHPAEKTITSTTSTGA